MDDAQKHFFGFLDFWMFFFTGGVSPKREKKRKKRK